MRDTWLVVGLGNPGPDYQHTRHNVGQLVVDILAARMGTRFSTNSRARALVAEGRFAPSGSSGPGASGPGASMPVGAVGARGAGASGSPGALTGPGPKVILAKPLTYMNLSGGPVSALAAYFSIDPAHIIAIHDEVDIPFDTLKLKRGGGEGGHNGLRDMSKALGTKEYLRVRVGVGRPPGRQDTADFVLRRFSATEAKDVPLHLERAADAVEELIEHGLALTQTRFH